MLDRWDAAGKTPVERIESFIQILVGNGSKIKRFGCPVGTLCMELAKLNHPLRTEANEPFVANGVVASQILEVTPSKTSRQLAFLQS